jgi:NADH dehydrogenase FAD-containing subunit
LSSARPPALIPSEQLVYLEGSEEALPYDVLSCNAGSYVPRDILQGNTENFFTAKPIEELLLAQARILECAAAGKVTIAVIGSGPSSLEIAGNIHQLCREKAVPMPRIRIFAGRNFLSGRPERVRRLARKMLARKGVEILENGYVEQIENGRIVVENARNIQPILFSTQSVSNRRPFLPAPVYPSDRMAD